MNRKAVLEVERTKGLEMQTFSGLSHRDCVIYSMIFNSLTIISLHKVRR